MTFHHNLFGDVITIYLTSSLSICGRGPASGRSCNDKCIVDDVRRHLLSNRWC